MNAKISFRIRILWMLLFNISLLSILMFGIVELFIKSRTMAYIAISTVLTILVFLTFFEIIFRKYTQKFKQKNLNDHQSPHRKMLEQMLYRIPNPPYNINAFLTELDDYCKYGLTRKILKSRASTDYNGTYIKITDGIRSGISPSSNFEKKIFVLGGSTVSCLEGPDDWTLPSQIQDQLNRLEIPKKIINLGVSGATTSDRFIAASDQESISSGDTLFFWFGVNEGKGLWGRRGKGILGFWPGFVEFFGLLRKYSKSTIINWLYLEIIRFDENAHRRLARTRASDLRNSFDKEFRKWAIEDVKVIAGLQPTIFSALGNITDREFLAKDWKPEMMTIMNIQYEEFRIFFAGASYFFDFSNSTKDDPASAFVDWVHLSWHGNKLVAEEICRSGIFANT